MLGLNGLGAFCFSAQREPAPGTGEAPSCPVYIDGQKFTTLKGSYDELSTAFRKLVDDYVSTKYPRKSAEVLA